MIKGLNMDLRSWLCPSGVVSLIRRYYFDTLMPEIDHVFIFWYLLNHSTKLGALGRYDGVLPKAIFVFQWEPKSKIKIVKIE